MFARSSMTLSQNRKDSIMGKLDGRTALVTGADRGIGREIAFKLAADGARVVVNDLDDEPALETAKEVEARGGKAAACAGSVTDPAFAQRFIDTAVDTFGGVDIGVNNAGYTYATHLVRSR